MRGRVEGMEFEGGAVGGMKSRYVNVNTSYSQVNPRPPAF